MTLANAIAAPIDEAALEGSIGDATRGLLTFKQPDGHFVFELEADATIPSEYVLLRHYLGELVDAALEAKIAVYLRRIQGAHGGWPLVHDGPFDMSASVKAYFALKMIGDSIDAPHMARAREAILSRGGAANVNVFTRFLLSFFEVLTWRSVPVLPVEIMLLPMWSPFHLNKISYWARTTMVPLMVLAALKPHARNPRGIGHPRTVRSGSRHGRHAEQSSTSKPSLVRAVQWPRPDIADYRATVSQTAACTRD